jgi:hypothetical protein
MWSAVYYSQYSCKKGHNVILFGVQKTSFGV